MLIFTKSAPVCLSLCPCIRETPTSFGCGDLWSKNVFLILACDDINSTKKSASGIIYLPPLHYAFKPKTPPFMGRGDFWAMTHKLHSQILAT